MARLARRRVADHTWPGFVDALSALLMVLIFLLSIFVLAQFFLQDALSGRDKALERLRAEVAELADLLALERQASADLRDSLAALTSQLADARDARDAALADLEAAEAAREAALANLAEAEGDTATARTALAAEEELSSEAQAEVARLQRDIRALKAEIAKLNAALDAAELKDEEAQAKIADLGRRLNRALATKVQELSRYRSDFFGRLREILGDKPGITIVGDRFVVQSEVLFATASAEIGPEGELQLKVLADTLIEISEEIPDDIDWVLQVAGHTDRRPINTPEFPSNWELSTARAVSVVKLLVDAGLPAERLFAAGFGDNQPIDPGDDTLSLARNRRIEFKLTNR